MICQMDVIEKVFYTMFNDDVMPLQNVLKNQTVNKVYVRIA